MRTNIPIIILIALTCLVTGCGAQNDKVAVGTSVPETAETADYIQGESYNSDWRAPEDTVATDEAEYDGDKSPFLLWNDPVDILEKLCF